MGWLSSAWPVQAILVHDGVAYATAGLLGQLDGAAMCAVDARTGAERWSKVFKNSGATYSNGKLKNETPSAHGGQMAWYGGKIWWQGVEFGPAVVDPATGALKRAVDESYLGDDDSMYYDLSGTWNLLRGKDIGILPGGWVAIGNELMHGACGQTDHVLLRSGPDGIPAGAEQAPQLLAVNLKGIGGAWFNLNREIPVWDASEVLTRGNPASSGGPPTLYRRFAETLNQAGDAQPIRAAVRKKLVPGTDDLVRKVSLTVPADQQHCVLPDALWNDIDKRQTVPRGTMLLSGNAVVLTVHGTGSRVTDIGNGRLPNYGDWRVIAIDRTDRTTLFDVLLPDAPAPSGMSLTRTGDVIVPLVDGRVICIGGGTAPRPLPAAHVAATAPGLRAGGYATDIPANQYHSWSAEDLAIMTPVQTRIAAELKFNAEPADDQRVVSLRGFLETPTTGNYRFHGKSAKGAGVRFTLLDRTGRFVENTFGFGEYGGQSVEVFLEKGKHPITAIVLQGSSGKDFNLQWEGPGIDRSDIPASALSHAEAR